MSVLKYSQFWQCQVILSISCSRFLFLVLLLGKQNCLIQYVYNLYSPHNANNKDLIGLSTYCTFETSLTYSTFFNFCDGVRCHESVGKTTVLLTKYYYLPSSWCGKRTLLARARGLFKLFLKFKINSLNYKLLNAKNKTPNIQITRPIRGN